jgi:lipopolysaccharide/colanic/teichoic acid biosynthesis glycosyltransferase
METSADLVGAKMPATILLLPCATRDKWSYRFAKRIFDFLLALVLFVLLGPTVLLYVAVLKLCLRGPVFYRQRRIGQNGRRFYLYKFRTMIPHSDSVLVTHLAAVSDARREWQEHQKLRKDPRVTRLGALLRRTSLDELPQVLNVLIGQMSFVGPRPIVEEELTRYGASLPFYTAVKPGLSGLWQVSGRGELSYSARVTLDVQYVKTWSFMQDMRILLKTPAAVWQCDGAY